MRFIYDEENDETIVEFNNKEEGRIDGRIGSWRRNMPHPDTDQFDEFAQILLQMSTPDERVMVLHLMAGVVEREGF